jgi:hypothetical protein
MVNLTRNTKGQEKQVCFVFTIILLESIHSHHTRFNAISWEVKQWTELRWSLAHIRPVSLCNMSLLVWYSGTWDISRLVNSKTCVLLNNVHTIFNWSVICIKTCVSIVAAWSEFQMAL